MAAITVKDLTVVFSGGVQALRHLDLEIQDGEFFALLGPSGCGKTTLLRSFAGLVRPAAGSIRIGEREATGLAPGARNLAMVFQDYALYPHMTVAENIAYPLKVRGMRKEKRVEAAQAVGRHLGLEQLMERRPAQLSGGQQQRVAVARAIACRPDAFLFDEPLSNLDARLRLEARTFLKRLQRELGTTTVYVTHDQAEAMAMADRMAVMEEGVIRQLGTPVEIFRRPANLFVAKFTGFTPMNLLPGRVSGRTIHLGERGIEIPSGLDITSLTSPEVVLAIRPEHVSLAGSALPDSLPGTVTVVENLGVDCLVTLEGSSYYSVQLLVPEEAAPAVGSSAWAAFDPRHLLLYDPVTTLLLASAPDPAPAQRAALGAR